MPYRFQPLYDLVLVRQATAAKFSPGGLEIPDSAMRAPNSGWVVERGEGILLPHGGLNELQVKVGDRVLFPQGAGYPVELELGDGFVYLILRENELLGTIHPIVVPAEPSAPAEGGEAPPEAKVPATVG